MAYVVRVWGYPLFGVGGNACRHREPRSSAGQDACRCRVADCRPAAFGARTPQLRRSQEPTISTCEVWSTSSSSSRRAMSLIEKGGFRSRVSGSTFETKKKMMHIFRSYFHQKDLTVVFVDDNFSHVYGFLCQGRGFCLH